MADEIWVWKDGRYKKAPIAHIRMPDGNVVPIYAMKVNYAKDAKHIVREGHWTIGP